MKIGIDNYGLLPLGFSPIETLQWASRHGAEGVAFSGLPDRQGKHLDKALLLDLKSFVDDHDMYIEWGGGQHFPLDMESWQRKEILSHNRIMAEESAYLNAKIVRSCSGGLMRWQADSPDTSFFINEMAVELKELKHVVNDLGVTWAIETHFELTSFELLEVFDRAGLSPDDGIGICLDTMNLLTMLEDTLEGSKRLLPWIVSTHIKDGGLLKSENGLKSFPAPVGKGFIPLPDIISALYSANPELDLSIEDHNGSFDLPINNAGFKAGFPDLTDKELQKLLAMAESAETYRSDIEMNYCNRSLWPSVCEERMAGDILKLKEIVANLEL
ncbi:MAG: sugar phosphate isomerase/epimerase [Bacteroidales bacterium]|nr:sugar phosphate isomerase/epimerase [Bacteroidales bacterium]